MLLLFSPSPSSNSSASRWTPLYRPRYPHPAFCIYYIGALVVHDLQGVLVFLLGMVILLGKLDMENQQLRLGAKLRCLLSMKHCLIFVRGLAEGRQQLPSRQIFGDVEIDFWVLEYFYTLPCLQSHKKSKGTGFFKYK